MFDWLRKCPRWQRLVMLIVLLIFTVHAGVTAYRRTYREGDFGVNREFGRRFVAGEDIYADNCSFNYMPISAAYYAPLAFVSTPVGAMLRYVVAIACLMATWHMLSQMTRALTVQRRWGEVAIFGLACLLSVHYVVRDLDDGGPHLILLAMLTAGIYYAWRERHGWSAMWFGLAIALKMTPGLFLPFMLWKRQWRLAGLTALATVLWIVSPALWMGVGPWWNAQQKWNSMALTVFSDTESAERIGNEVRVQNQSLRPAVERMLVTYPPGHPLRLNHPAEFYFLNWQPRQARLASIAVVGVLLLLCAWQSRKAYTSAQDPNWLLEASGVLLLTVLLSPVTWLQHVVMVLPACYLLVTQDRTIGRLPRAAYVALGIYAMASLGLNRELLGAENYWLLLGYHVHTACMLVLLGLLLFCKPTANSQTPVTSLGNETERPLIRAAA